MTRSLVCDAEGIIVAETVFRCVRCATVLTSVQTAQQHYYHSHMDSDEESGMGEEQDRQPHRESADMDMGTEESGQVSPSSSLSDSHPTVVKALTAAFNPCHGPDRSGSQMDVGANLNGMSCTLLVYVFVCAVSVQTNARCDHVSVRQSVAALA